MLLALALAATAAQAKDAPKASFDAGSQGQDRPVRKAEPAADPNLAVRVKGHISRQLWKDRMAALPADAGKGQKDELEQLIERVNGVQLRPRPKGGVPAAAPERPGVVDANAAPTGQPVASAGPAAAATDQPGEANSAARASLIAVEGVDPNAVTHPFRMAEILYASGRTRQAAPFYQRALAQLDGQDHKTAAQRQWILLQLGRCWRQDDPAQARRMFSQLISEYPDSPWVDLARAWQGLTDWYLTERPSRLIEQTPGPAPKAGAGR